MGHIAKRCPSAVKLCSLCNSEGHVAVNCPKKQKNESTGRKTRRGRSKDKQAWREVDKAKADISLTSQSQASLTVPVRSEIVQAELHKSQLGTAKDKVVGESSNTPFYLLPVRARSRSGASGSSRSDVQPDSSDVESSDSDLEEGELSKHDLELGFQVVRNKKKFSGQKFSGQKGNRGRGPNQI